MEKHPGEETNQFPPPNAVKQEDITQKEGDRGDTNPNHSSSVDMAGWLVIRGFGLQEIHVVFQVEAQSGNFRDSRHSHNRAPRQFGVFSQALKRPHVTGLVWRSQVPAREPSRKTP